VCQGSSEAGGEPLGAEIGGQWGRTRGRCSNAVGVAGMWGGGRAGALSPAPVPSGLLRTRGRGAPWRRRGAQRLPREPAPPPPRPPRPAGWTPSLAARKPPAALATPEPAQRARRAPTAPRRQNPEPGTRAVLCESCPFKSETWGRWLFPPIPAPRLPVGIASRWGFRQPLPLASLHR
jgi:hypothetical protein